MLLPSSDWSHIINCSTKSFAQDSKCLSTSKLRDYLYYWAYLKYTKLRGPYVVVTSLHVKPWLEYSHGDLILYDIEYHYEYKWYW